MDNITMKNNADHLILMALHEDISSEDVSTNSVVRKKTYGSAQLLCKEDGIIAGLDVFKRVFELLDDDIRMETSVSDGDMIKNGQLIATIIGDVKAIL